MCASFFSTGVSLLLLPLTFAFAFTFDVACFGFACPAYAASAVGRLLMASSGKNMYLAVFGFFVFLWVL